MIQKIALLRGINVGGHHIIKMADLKEMMSNLGFTEVNSYIQSGNILFNTADQSNAAISEQVKKDIEARFGYKIPVIVLDTEKLLEASKNNPFLKTETDITRLHLSFLSNIPDTENATQLIGFDASPDAFSLYESFVYLNLDIKYHNTKLSNAFIEKKLGVESTTRNWKTVMKLVELTLN